MGWTIRGGRRVFPMTSTQMVSALRSWNAYSQSYASTARMSVCSACVSTVTKKSKDLPQPNLCVMCERSGRRQQEVLLVNVEEGLRCCLCSAETNRKLSAVGPRFSLSMFISGFNNSENVTGNWTESTKSSVNFIQKVQAHVNVSML